MKPTIYALGFFDGVHLGHQALLHTCRELAEQNHCLAGVITFTTHPDALVAGKAPCLLHTAEDRRLLLSGYGMDIVVELPFDEKLMQTHWLAFLTDLVEGGAAGLFVAAISDLAQAAAVRQKNWRPFAKNKICPMPLCPSRKWMG